MKSQFWLLLVSGVAFISPSFATEKTADDNRVLVVYDEPEKFTDFNSSGFGSATEKDLKYLTEFFTEHISKVAKQNLAADERLEVTFKDIDLAGRFEPEHGPNFQNVRFFRDITYPRMVLDFRLLGSDGQVLAEGERKLSDMNYNMNLRLPMGDDEFRHDKALLTDWIRSEFRKKK